MIYYHHIGGTGGRSIIVAFLSLFDAADRFGEFFHVNSQVMVDGHMFARNQVAPSNLFFGCSHQPIYECTIPYHAIRFTTLRDPIRRYLTFYRRYVSAQLVGRDSGPQWKGSGIIDTLKRVPKRTSLNQLWMFSSTYQPRQAYRNIQNLTYHFRCEDMATGLVKLEQLTGLGPLPLYRIRTHFDDVPIWARRLAWWIVQEELQTPGVLEFLQEFFAPEYELMEMLYGTSYWNSDLSSTRTYKADAERAPWPIP